MSLPHSPKAILVYGANGHTGRFIARELIEQGLVPILSGRNRAGLEAASAAHGGLEVRTAPLEDAEALDRALGGAAAVINAAGPFAFTVAPLVDAAIRAAVPYLDVAAETDVAAATIANHGDRARTAGIALVPSTAFFGGLGNLLATAAMGDWPRADEITLAYALSSWKPTPGTRATIAAGGVRRGGQRLVFADGQLEMRPDDAPVTEWTFPAPVGRQAVVGEFTTADCITISRHLQTRAIAEYMTLAPLEDLSDPDLAPPPAADNRGRSAQVFLLEAGVRRGTERRTAVARGTDIYAVTAPLVVEAVRRLLREPRRWRGVVTAAELGNPRSYLDVLAPRHLDWDAG
jgi:short subunit dehydrogenase-like uncharacterized protein